MSGWTQDEKLRLRVMYADASVKELRAACGGRAWNTICTQAMKMGLDRRFKARTDGAASRHKILRALRRHRINQKIHRRALAKKIGYHETTLANWESGRHPPHFLALVAWAEALGVSLTIAKAKSFKEPEKKMATMPEGVRFSNFDRSDAERAKRAA